MCMTNVIHETTNGSNEQAYIRHFIGRQTTVTGWYMDTMQHNVTVNAKSDVHNRALAGHLVNAGDDLV